MKVCEASLKCVWPHPSHVSHIPKAGSSYITAISAISAISSQPDPFMLSAAVGSSNYATTPVECCSHAWTSFLTLYDFSALRTRACVLHLRPVCTRVCARACVHVRMHVPLRNRVRVVRLSSHVCVCWVPPNVLVNSNVVRCVCDQVGVTGSPFSRVQMYMCASACACVCVCVCVCVWERTRQVCVVCSDVCVCVCISGCWKCGAVSAGSKPRPLWLPPSL